MVHVMRSEQGENSKSSQSISTSIFVGKFTVRSPPQQKIQLFAILFAIRYLLVVPFAVFI